MFRAFARIAFDAWMPGVVSLANDVESTRSFTVGGHSEEVFGFATTDRNSSDGR